MIFRWGFSSISVFFSISICLKTKYSEQHIMISSTVRRMCHNAEDLNYEVENYYWLLTHNLRLIYLHTFFIYFEH